MRTRANLDPFLESLNIEVKHIRRVGGCVRRYKNYCISLNKLCFKHWQNCRNEDILTTYNI